MVNTQVCFDCSGHWERERERDRHRKKKNSFSRARRIRFVRCFVGYSALILRLPISTMSTL